MRIVFVVLLTVQFVAGCMAPRPQEPLSLADQYQSVTCGVDDIRCRQMKFVLSRLSGYEEVERWLHEFMSQEKVNNPFELNSAHINFLWVRVYGKAEYLPCYNSNAVQSRTEAQIPCYIEPKSSAKQKAWIHEFTATFDQVPVLFSPDALISPYMFRAVTGDGSNRAYFSGECSRLVKVQASLPDIRTFDYAAFEQTHQFNKLPISKLIMALKSALAQQCSDFAGMRIYISIPNKNIVHPATLLEENGWRIVDGIQPSRYDSEYVVNLAINTAFVGGDGIGTVYRGGCARNATLPMKHIFENETQRAFPTSYRFADYINAAKVVSREYLAQCPSTESIAFSISEELPENLVCKNQSACMTLSKDNGWEVDSTAVAAQEPPPPPEKQCITSMFCDYPGGDYLNVIYEGDAGKFVGVDNEYMGVIRESAREWGILQSSTNQSALVRDISAMPEVIKTYMHHYAVTSAQCLRQDAVAVPVSLNIAERDLTTMSGVLVQRFHGYNFSKTVFINREFADACRRDCSPTGDSNPVSIIVERHLNGGRRQEIVQGIKQMMAEHPCGSPEIKQFERNLLEIYGRMYD